MEGLDKTAMDSDYNQNIGLLVAAAQTATKSLNAKLTLDQVPTEGRSGILGGGGRTNSARFGGLDMLTFSAFTPMNYGMGGASFMYSAAMGGNWFRCPVTVPFCAREACPNADEIGAHSNAFHCYTQPGCCFDQVLFQHRLAFGPNLFKSVPVCYRAIDNKIFHTLAQQSMINGGHFHPSFVPALVSKVFEMNSNPVMANALREIQGCPPPFGSVFGFSLLNRIAPGNYMVQMFLSKQNSYNEFVDVLSQVCGWPHITKNDCVLRGCCWNDLTFTCTNPLESNISTERLTHAIQYMTTRSLFSRNNGRTGSIAYGVRDYGDYGMSQPKTYGNLFGDGIFGGMLNPWGGGQTNYGTSHNIVGRDTSSQTDNDSDGKAPSPAARMGLLSGSLFPQRNMATQFGYRSNQAVNQNNFNPYSNVMNLQQMRNQILESPFRLVEQYFFPKFFR